MTEHLSLVLLNDRPSEKGNHGKTQGTKAALQARLRLAQGEQKCPLRGQARAYPTP